MKILMLGDVYGQPGRYALNTMLQGLKAEHGLDFIIANGENVTHGKSIIEKHYQELKAMGVNVVTSGNHIFKNPAVLDYIDRTPDLLRPLNFNTYLPGNGFVIQEVNGIKIAVVNLMGTSFMNEKADNPYEAFDAFLALKLDYDYLIVDFHAEATAEKLAFAWNYDGIIDVFVGTHTHVQTADERILPKGTVYLTDLGMCGAYDSIIGANPEEIIIKEKTGVLTRFKPAKANVVQLNGFIVEFNDQHGLIAFYRVQLKEAVHG